MPVEYKLLRSCLCLKAFEQASLIIAAYVGYRTIVDIIPRYAAGFFILPIRHLFKAAIKKEQFGNANITILAEDTTLEMQTPKKQRSIPLYDITSHENRNYEK